MCTAATAQYRAARLHCSAKNTQTQSPPATHWHIAGQREQSNARRAHLLRRRTLRGEVEVAAGPAAAARLTVPCQSSAAGADEGAQVDVPAARRRHAVPRHPSLAPRLTPPGGGRAQRRPRFARACAPGAACWLQRCGRLACAASSSVRVPV
jgi:hypothetical protein